MKVAQGESGRDVGSETAATPAIREQANAQRNDADAPSNQQNDLSDISLVTSTGI